MFSLQMHILCLDTAIFNMLTFF